MDNILLFSSEERYARSGWFGSRVENRDLRLSDDLIRSTGNILEQVKLDLRNMVKGVFINR